jgi:hypothetical protein
MPPKKKSNASAPPPDRLAPDTDAKRVDAKRTDAKRDDAKRADPKRTDAKRTDGKRTDAKPSDAKRADAKSTDGNLLNAKRTDSGRAPSKNSAPPRRAKKGTIEDAIELAVRAHRGQVDKYHLPYIVHIFGVAAKCRTIEEKIVAFLHDTVEDGHATLQQLRRLGFSERVIAAVECLSRRKGESYEAFVDRIAPNPLARVVKLADLEDNMDVRRSDRAMKDKDAERMEKYRRAWQRLAALVVSDDV